MTGFPTGVDKLDEKIGGCQASLTSSTPCARRIASCASSSASGARDSPMTAPPPASTPCCPPRRSLASRCRRSPPGRAAPAAPGVAAARRARRRADPRRRCSVPLRLGGRNRAKDCAASSSRSSGRASTAAPPASQAPSRSAAQDSALLPGGWGQCRPALSAPSGSVTRSADVRLVDVTVFDPHYWHSPSSAA
jgi:hypothetical protein